MMKYCLVAGCPHVAVKGRSRCSRHGPTNPGGIPRDWEHQRNRKAIITSTTVCAADGRPGTPEDPLELDHILPVSMGGTNARSNLQVLHRSENRRKGGRDRIR